MTTVYRYLGYGTTDSNGIAKLAYDANGDPLTNSYTGTGAGEVDVVGSTDAPADISDSSFQSEPYSIWDYIKCDINNSLAVSDYNLRYDTDTLVVADTGKKFTSTETSGRRVYLPLSNVTECVLEFEAKYSTIGSIGVSGETTSTLTYANFNNTDWLYVKITFTNGTVTMKTSEDYSTWTNKALSSSSLTAIGNLFFTVQNGDVYFRNIRVYPL